MENLKKFLEEQGFFPTGIVETRDLYKKFNSDEFAELSRRLGEARRLKKRGADMEKEVLSLIDTKGDMEEIKCAWAANIENKTIDCFRVDNQEKIDHRPMKQAEVDKYSQPSLFPDGKDGEPMIPEAEKLDGVPYPDDYGVCRHKGCPLRRVTDSYKIIIPAAIDGEPPEELEVCFKCYVDLRNIKGPGGSKDSGPYLGYPPDDSDVPILVTDECPECRDADEPCDDCRAYFLATTGYDWEPDFLFSNSKQKIKTTEPKPDDADILTEGDESELSEEEAKAMKEEGVAEEPDAEPDDNPDWEE